MAHPTCIRNTIHIQAPLKVVDRVITDQSLMHRWLNPALRCVPVGEWNTEVGGRSRFILQIPGLKPALDCSVVERAPGLVVWAFDGFFQGCDRWECQPTSLGTHLTNQFEFIVRNPLVAFGFQTFALGWTRQDMQAQLQRLKQVAESLPQA
ncbi:SRPBCC family protein [Synechococcales cyanobacterium C]|uniref:SRPBCC family protein n=1 Tax=Petrachloros mirabilis ULC683 TaxID=2781853 RepID=A0A8K1ZWB1_9CYAN|nr:SRPBCC family protein [Petrachloros mirabilis]NCJ05261.1 SRPBCC family protein [Petrachloros mirabilis ULC683]